VPVPANAESGPISVATPAGSAITSTDFFVVPTAYTPSQVDFTGEISAGGSYTGTIVNGGDIGLVAFSATAGQNFSLLVNGSTIASATISIMYPGGSLLEQAMIGVGGTVLDSISAPKAGVYTILVASNGAAFTGSLTLNLSQNSSSANSPGSTTTGQIVVGTSGQNATVLFYGVAGQSVSVQISNSNFPHCASLNFNILDPFGTSVGTGYMCDSSGFVGPVVLTTTGTYTLVITPGGGGTGSANITISLFNDQTIPVTPAASGTTSTLVTINTPGQKAELPFSGVQNQLASVSISNSTFPGCASMVVNILNPNGSLLNSNSMMCYSAKFLNLVTLPATGNYTLVITPSHGGTGSAVVALSLFSNVTGTITPGTPTAVAINMPGQGAGLAFNGNVGQTANVQFTSNFSNCSYYSVLESIVEPNGKSVTSGDSCAGPVYVPPVTFTAAGTYTLVIAPNNGNTGVANVTLTLQ